MNVDLDQLRELLHNPVPNTVLVMAADVYDRLARGELGDQTLTLNINQSIQIQRSTTATPGMVYLLPAIGTHDPGRWADQFLAKSGPGSKPGVMPYEPLAVSPKAPKPPKPPQPPPSPQPPQPPRPKVRQRIVDT
jgi:hypothetical protein